MDEYGGGYPLPNRTNPVHSAGAQPWARWVGAGDSVARLQWRPVYFTTGKAGKVLRVTSL